MKILKGQKSLFRYTVMVSACVTLVQAIIWGLFAVGAILHYLINNEIKREATVRAIFHNMYFSRAGGKDFPSIAPTYVHIFMWYYLILSCAWTFFSLQLLKVFVAWTDMVIIRKRTKIWIILTLVVCVSDFVLFIIFVIDFRHIIVNFTGNSDKYFQHFVKENETYSYRRGADFNESVIDENTTNPSLSIYERNPFVLPNLKARWRGAHINNPFLDTESSTVKTDTSVYNPKKKIRRPTSKISIGGGSNAEITRAGNREQEQDPQLCLRRISGKLDKEGNELVALTLLNRLVFPPGIMMTMAARGYFIWFLNLALTIFVIYLYQARIDKPTLLTRVSR